MRKSADTTSTESLERRSSHLEALHRVGVDLAGSFNIESILSQIARTAGQLVGFVPIDVYYAGSSTINSKPKWFSSASADSLSGESRKKLAKEFAQISGNGAKDVSTFVKALESRLRDLPDGTHRHLVPISQNEEFLGFIIVKSPLDREDHGLLSILCLQAATALANIHLTQERIHTERLSAFGQMIGSLVHDFRSPLTAVRGYVGMLGQTDLQTPERDQFSLLAIEECDRLNSMIDELLEFTRGSHSGLEPHPILVGDFIRDLTPAIRTHFEDSHTDLEIHLGYRGTLHIDPGRMKRAVLNVVSNASQAMNGHGKFVIRTECMNDRVILEFQDTGCGIPEEIRHRIFEPFFSHGKPQGFGLGMAIARKIIEEHGGDVELASETGKGTSVRFVLPLEDRTRELENSKAQEVTSQ